MQWTTFDTENSLTSISLLFSFLLVLELALIRRVHLRLYQSALDSFRLSPSLTFRVTFSAIKVIGGKHHLPGKVYRV